MKAEELLKIAVVPWNTLCRAASPPTIVCPATLKRRSQEMITTTWFIRVRGGV